MLKMNKYPVEGVLFASEDSQGCANNNWNAIRDGIIGYKLFNWKVLYKTI